jgi:hypothetical protein
VQGSAGLDVVNNDQLDVVVALCRALLIPRPEDFHLPNEPEPSRVNDPGKLIFPEATCLGFDNPWLRLGIEETSSRQGERYTCKEQNPCSGPV